MSTALFIVGPPAAGKTTLARQLLGDVTHLVAKPKWTIGDRVCAAGHYTGDTFDGADRVGYNQVADTLGYWRDNIAPTAKLTIFDGDRFSYVGAVKYVAQHCKRVCCVFVDADEWVLAPRRAARNWAPDPTWLKGRETKAARFYFLFPEADRSPVASLSDVLDFLGGAP